MASKIRKSLFERLRTGLEECIAHAKGELTLKKVEVPDVSSSYLASRFNRSDPEGAKS